HEEYAVQRWPETKRLLGLLVNSSGGAHARNARRLIHAARKQDRRLAAALLAAALAHTPDAEEALRGARTRMARKPPALARELLRNFPKRRSRASKRRRRAEAEGEAVEPAYVELVYGRGGVEGSPADAGEAAQAPSDAVLSEALASEALEQPDSSAELAPGADDELQRNVQEALDHASEALEHSDGPLDGAAE